MRSNHRFAAQPIGRRIKRTIWQAMVLSLLATSAALRAADAQPAADTAAAPSAEQKSASANSAPGAPVADSAKTSEKDSVFRPSEDISEDLAVPFPVDI